MDENQMTTLLGLVLDPDKLLYDSLSPTVWTVSLSLRIQMVMLSIRFGEFMMSTFPDFDSKSRDDTPTITIQVGPPWSRRDTRGL